MDDDQGTIIILQGHPAVPGEVEDGKPAASERDVLIGIGP